MPEPTVIQCEYGEVPQGTYALIPRIDLQTAVKRFQNWQRTKNAPLPQTVYQTKLGFYFPLEEQE